MRQFFYILSIISYVWAILTSIGKMVNFANTKFPHWYLNLLFALAFFGGCWLIAKWFWKKA